MKADKKTKEVFYDRYKKSYKLTKEALWNCRDLSHCHYNELCLL